MTGISKLTMSLSAVSRALGVLSAAALATVVLGSCASGEGDPPTDEELCSVCHADAECTVELGVATCTCLPGYQDTSGNGSVCNDIDECATNNDDCDDRAVCANTVGSYTCTCGDGYDGDGSMCFDIDECTEDGVCDANATCRNYDGAYDCECNDGYVGDGLACADADECADGSHECHVDATCSNTVGSYQCTCAPGYAGDGITCNDLNECLLGVDMCTGISNCSNLPGSYECLCPTGYLDEFGDSSSCLLGGAGRVYLIGHDYFINNQDNNRLLGNAVFAANTTDDVRILGYTGYADNSPGQEVGNVNAAINARAAELNRGFTLTTFSDYTQISNLLIDKHVLLIYEQEDANVASMVNVGTAWALTLNAFVDAGGTVILTDFDGSTWQILNRSGLMNISSTATIVSGGTLVVREPSHSLVESVAGTYQATTGTRYYNVSNAVSLVSDTANRSVVWARTQTNDCVTIDDFETGSWPNGRWWSPLVGEGGTPSLGAAHDFAWGLVDPDWHYQVDVTAGEFGERVRMWTRFESVLSNVSLGFASADWGTYSLTIDRWINRMMIQHNPDYNLIYELASADFAVDIGKWYLLEVQFGSGGLVTVRIYEEFNPSPLATLNTTIAGLRPGGTAIRASYGGQIDSPEVCPAP